MQLAALGFEVRDVATWRALLVDVLGMVEVEGLRFRMDGHAWRISLREGPADDLAFVAWEVGDAAPLVARLQAAGVDVRETDPAILGVEQRFSLVDPAGVPTELVVRPARATSPFTSPVAKSGFVADELGLGHVVLATRDKAESTRFYTELLGFRLSDHVVCELYGFPVDLSFFHSNPRHHSLALGGPLGHRLHHFMLETRDLDDVGRGHDRALQLGLPIANTIGRHPNDRMLSFYARTPSGFQFELGWGARTIDDEAGWTPATYDRVSEWGHLPPQLAYRRGKSSAP